MLPMPYSQYGIGPRITFRDCLYINMKVNTLV
nr:MAG TPA: hypothetical protein [Caudoviricetes sp.]